MHLPTLLLSLLFTLVASQRETTAVSYSNAQRNESGIYGYQLVGSGFSKDFKGACNDINILDQRRWLALFLDPYYIQRMEKTDVSHLGGVTMGVCVLTLTCSSNRGLL